MRHIRNLLCDLIFWGYSESEYQVKSQAELKVCRVTFTTQIRIVTILSFIVIAIDAVALFLTCLFMEWGEFVKATPIFVEMLIVLLVTGLTIASIFSKITSGILSLVYFAISGLLLFRGNEASLFLCILCAFGYLRIVFSHMHREDVDKFIDDDDFHETRQVIKGTGYLREELKKSFRKYEEGGINPLNNQENHEAVFEKSFEIDNGKNNDEILTGFSQEELDALLGESKKPEIYFDIDGVIDITKTDA